jgi:carboxymethylenebutenolidase
MSQTQPDGYLAMPPTGQGDPVLLLHAWWGLNDTIKALAERLAGSGFITFAPDLYHGRIADTIEGAETLAGSLFNNLDRPRADIARAVTFLNDRAGQDSPGIAVIGFSLGAFFALDLSVTVPEQIRSVVIFYGTRPGDYSPSRASYLGHFASTDDFEPQSEVDNLEESLRRAGRPVTFYQYEGTGRWFFEPDRVDAYNPAAAALAWERTLGFLRDPARL